MFFKKKDNKENIVNNRKDNNVIKSSIYGFIIGDALGVPAEFLNRETLKRNPIKDMEEYGTHNQPKGTWSDDTSMVLATIDGLINSNNSIDYQKIMSNFLNWMKEGKYTPFNYVFDIGNATRYALSKYQNNIYDNKVEEINCGTGDINSNGNGSLMRILPISLYLYYLDIDYNDKRFFEIIKTISSMTHSHIYSILGGYIYTIYVIELLKGNDKFIAYKNMQDILKNMCKKNNDLIDIKNIYGRIIYQDISKLKENDIKSSGYVVDSLEACIWSILTTNSFESSILKAVNLGDDTDTIAALTGGLAGIIYGYNSIPKNWINSLQKKEYLDNVIDNFIEYLNKLTIKDEVSNKQLIKDTLDDLKNNPKSCTLEDGRWSNTSEKVNQFIEYMYNNNLIDKNYLENHKKINGKNIEDMTRDEVLTSLTWVVRGERFCDGFIYGNYKDKTLLRLVERLYELSNKSNEQILNKFIDMQNRDYDIALSEIKNGKKKSHWMWYMFPQIEGLGYSEISKYYAIKNLDEAKLYLKNDILRNRLLNLLDELLKLDTNNPIEIFGQVDSLKLKSSMTLFHLADNTIEQFYLVLKKYFNGQFDNRTEEIIKKGRN